MVTIEHKFLINAEPKEINEVVLDPELLPVWLPGELQVKSDTEVPDDGRQRHITFQTKAGSINFTQTVQEVEANQNIIGYFEGVISGNYNLSYQPEDEGTCLVITLNCKTSEDVIQDPIDDVQLESIVLNKLDEGLKNIAGMVRARRPLTRSDVVTAREYMSLKGEIDAAFQRVLASGIYTQEEEIAALESEFAAFCGVRYAINTSSGTMALLVGLRALGIGPGDEVITACYDDHGPPVAITNSGATIRFVDIEEETLTLDPDQLEAALTPKTRAILPVHIHGQVADMNPIRKFAERYDLLILEDGALATGATYHGRRVGSLAHAGVFSFGPGKIFSGFGWGGMVTTDDPAIAARAAQFAGHGPYEPMCLPVLPQVTEHVEGYSALMSSLVAAGLRVKLPHLDEWIERRRAIAKRFDDACDRLGLGRLHPRPETETAPRTYILRSGARDHLLRYLRREGVRASVPYVPPMHLRTVYFRLGYQHGDFPVAEHVASELIGLPIHPQLTDEEVAATIDCLERFH